MFLGRYLRNEWSEDTIITLFFDVASDDLSIEQVSRYGFHGDNEVRYRISERGSVTVPAPGTSVAGRF